MKGHKLEFKRPDAVEAEGFYAEPTEGPDAPGIVVIMEWWGLNSHIRDFCERLSAGGYRALAPDLYKGTLVPYDQPDVAAKKMRELDFEEAVSFDIVGAVDHLKKRSKRVGVVGFCMGGALSILSALEIPSLDAAVAFYGIPPEDRTDPAKMKIPFQGHFAGEDDWVTAQKVDWLEQKLKESGAPFEIHRYPFARHAFFNEQRKSSYNPSAAAEAWDRMHGFFSKYLKRGP